MTAGSEAPFRAVSVGDVMIDHLVDLSDGRSSGYPEANRTYFEPIRTGVNGVGLTFAVHLAERGIETAFVGAIGGAVGAGGRSAPIVADLAGREALDHLAAAGVTAHVAILPGVATGKTCMVYVNPHDRMIVSDRGANAGLTLDHLCAEAWAAIDRADLLFVSGYFLVDAVQREAMRALMRRARAAGALVAVDVVPHEILRHVPPADYLDWIADADALLLTNATMHDYLGRDSSAATWRAPVTRVGPEDLVPALERFEIVVVTLDDASDYLVATRDGHLIVPFPHRSFRETLRRDATEAGAHILAQYLRGGRTLDRIAGASGVRSAEAALPA